MRKRSTRLKWREDVDHEHLSNLDFTKIIEMIGKTMSVHYGHLSLCLTSQIFSSPLKIDINTGPKSTKTH